MRGRSAVTQNSARALLLLALVITFGYHKAILDAQEVSSGITGRITDPSDAALVGVSVTAKDVERGTVWPTETNTEGIYAFPRLPAGNYELRIEAKGFRTALRQGIVLEINQRARVDIQMELGSIAESVEVTAAGPLLQTETTVVGSVISGTTNVNLPLNGRNFVQLTLLTPGTATVNPAGFTNGLRTVGGGRPYVNGNREEANNFLLDGVENNSPNNNATAYLANVDAIQEFKMITNNASAEFGNFQGGIVNVTIKSGTNAFHGTVFEFLRNDKLNANSWARNWQNSPKPAMRHNVFGATIGGPIIRDKLFFFTDYQGIRRAQPGAPGFVTVIPAEFRSGDLSRLLTERGVQLYDPLTTDGSGRRQPFANNQIPQPMINAVARNLFNSPDLYPAPINSGLRFNALNQASTYVNSDQGDIKLDGKPSSRDDLSVRYSKGRQDNPGINTFPLIFNTFQRAPLQNGVVNWTRTIRPTLVNELRMGVNTIMFTDGAEDKGFGNVGQKLGIQGSNDRGPGLLSIQFTGGLADGIGNQNIGGLRMNTNNAFHYADNLTVIRGRHLMKTGFQFIRQQANVFFAGNNGRVGFIRFTGQYTSGPNANSPSSKGLAEADFLLGYPTRLGRGLDTGTWGQRKNIIGGYFQDDWRVNNSLTLNLGLRWEYHSPFVEVKDRQTNFEFYTGRMLIAGQDGNSRALYNDYKRDWQPRVGFAWTPGFLGSKTVLRGAYTISSFMEGTGVNLRLPLNPPFATEFEAVYEGQTQVGSTTDQGLSVLRAADPFKGANIRLWDPNVRPAEVQQWSFLIERQLPQETVISAGYVGQHGTHLIVPLAYSQRRLVASGKVEPSLYVIGNPLLAQVANVQGTGSDGNQRYDSLQVSMRRRLAQGFEYQLSYTWSKGMTDSIGFFGEGGQAGAQSAYWQNLYNRRAEWGPTYFDLTHNFVYSAIYQLPFGRGKQFGAGWNPLVDRLFGGWQVGGILSLHGGFPLTISALDRSGTLSRGPRADRIADGAGKREVGPGAAWFDTSAFRQPVAGTMGTSGVGVVRGPGFRNFDLSVQKSIPVKESKRFEFRSEFFNLTNTPKFNTPDLAVQSATFGEVTAAQGEREIQFALKFYF